ncbi:hypothetical protein HYN48_07225 [Flavobacterium magnum]|uniref:Uncharacterized protein n=1 Tax=Flavobacterium magnum TaxID=2162713 RepID=A0A2S0RE34_9FLAO|nr:hypothetical protein [Flavobacterium magnum]AWA29884.1 hypothetical protein HYN48_07225 [Flavobacterium magnum]
MTSENVIPLETAQEWAHAWVTSGISPVKAYLIPEADITQLMEEADVQDVRAYMGIDANGVSKMMLVGVDKNGKDLIDYSKGLYVYDFTMPCPNTCDVASPLYFER